MGLAAGWMGDGGWGGGCEGAVLTSLKILHRLSCQRAISSASTEHPL